MRLHAWPAPTADTVVAGRSTALGWLRSAVAGSARQGFLGTALRLRRPLSAFRSLDYPFLVVCKKSRKSKPVQSKKSKLVPNPAPESKVRRCSSIHPAYLVVVGRQSCMCDPSWQYRRKRAFSSMDACECSSARIVLACSGGRQRPWHNTPACSTPHHRDRQHASETNTQCGQRAQGECLVSAEIVLIAHWCPALQCNVAGLHTETWRLHT